MAACVDFFFFLLLKKRSLFKSTDGRTGVWSSWKLLFPRLRLGEVSLSHLTLQGSQQLFVPAQHFVLLGTALTFPIQFDFLEKKKKQSLKIAFKAAGKARFLLKIPFNFFPPTQILPETGCKYFHV